MNKINFNQTGGFPLSTNTLEEIQKAYTIFNELGKLGGDNYIVTGCENIGNTVQAGYVYMRGELLPFRGGAKQTKVIVKQDVESRVFEDGQTKEVYYNRYVAFGTGADAVDWAIFKRVENILEISEKLKTHKHKWEDITDPPETYKPSQHNHQWQDITNPPETYKPSPHKHDWGDITGANFPRVVVAGYLGQRPKKIIKRYVGNFRLNNGYGGNVEFEIIHNLGHSDYVVLAQAVSERRTTIKANCFYTDNNICRIITADDASPNACDVKFAIITMR